MAKEKFTVQDLEHELQRRNRQARASPPKLEPKKPYANSDRYGEDGRRIYSAYYAATEQRPRPTARLKRVRLAAVALTLVAVALFIIMSAIPR